MNKRLRTFVMVAVAGGVIGSAAVAEAGRGYHPAGSRQHTTEGVWKSGYRSTGSQGFWHPFRFWDGQPVYRGTPASKGTPWGWQRGSRAELHHGGPRSTRGN
ncbi:hypothetical protein [Candidatus Laterigemmans baculatus]|uniref:hypothetical protein n=1 Tax=Candidatus Laterigemmans baculatus TaxID=2770505 RepID=UPI0013D9D902|nr:hypothetical protein [Candidatus Laterigemmans baculatus]